ncbi:MAG: arylesterase [Pseudomonadota bacterium]
MKSSVVISALLLLLGAVATPRAEHAAQGAVLVLGDSLSAGYNLSLGAGWVDLLGNRLAACGVEVVNASISGETSAGGLSRLPDLLTRHHPSIVVVELGGNDGLRGQPTMKLYENLREIAVKSAAAGAQVVLAGIQIPGNYGARYRRNFAEIYPKLAGELELKLIPFFMDGVALNPELMLSDGIHPNAAGQPRLLANVMPALAPLLPTCDLSQTPPGESKTSQTTP